MNPGHERPDLVFCVTCGAQIGPTSQFCSSCGDRQPLEEWTPTVQLSVDEATDRPLVRADQPTELIKRYLGDHGGVVEVASEDLLSTWELDGFTDESRQAIDGALSRSGIQVNPRMSEVSRGSQRTYHRVDGFWSLGLPRVVLCWLPMRVNITATAATSPAGSSRIAIGPARKSCC